MKNIYLTTVVYLLLVLNTNGMYAQTSGPCEGSSCSANDFNLTNFFLGDNTGAAFGDGSCTPGDSVDAHIWVDFSATASAGRYSLYLYFDVKLTDVEGNITTSTETVCLYPNLDIPTDGSLDIYTFIWQCGDEVELSNFYMSWQTAESENCEENNSNCYCDQATKIINAPLIANFVTQSECIVGQSIENITFTDATTGGLEPYTDYSWDFGTDATPATANTVGPHTISYSTTGTKTIIIVTTDSNGGTETESKDITIGDANCCVLDINCPSSFTDTASCYNSLPVAATNQTELENLGLIFNKTCGDLYISHSDTGDPGCNGDVTRTYTILDDRNGNGTYENGIDEQTTCNQTITINYSSGLIAPDNTSSTISCPADASDPGMPNDITDACGRNISAEFVSSDALPDCEGSVVWTYRYTACDGTTTADWTHTYTIDYSGSLTAPNNTSSTVTCTEDASAPGAPNDITDACGRNVSAVFVSSDALPDCEGLVVWTYRYTACDGTTTADWTHTYTIDYSGVLTAPDNTSSTVSCPADASDPGAPNDITDACGNNVSAVFVSSDPLPNCEGSVVWTYRYTTCDGTATADWTHVYTIDYSGDLTAPDNTSSTVSCPADASDPGAPNDITDPCGRNVSAVFVSSDSLPNCKGSVVWTYRYTSCDGTATADWTHTYTIDYSSGLTTPDNTSSTISCPEDANDPGAPIDITDACGRNVSAEFVSSDALPDCEGSVVWTYRYTACDETTTADWTHTYTIDYSGDLTAPDSTSSTVSCPEDATDPGAPNDITDACGRNVSVVFVSSDALPDCEGSMVWTYRYTACDGTTTADWTHTYTIDVPNFSLPENGSNTVSCVVDAQLQPTPPDVNDWCGNAIIPSEPIISSDPTCQGIKTYTWTYIDCAGNSNDWVYTYTIEDDIAPDLANCNLTNTILECSATDNEAMADQWNTDNILAIEACITDNCDADLNGQVTSDYNFGNLNTTCGPCGTLNVVYTITDDCDNSATLTLTLTLDDGTNPDLSNCNVNDQTLECNGTDNESIADQWNTENISALEACADDISISVTSNYEFTNLSSICGQGGTLAVLYTITDDCNNSTTLNATLTLKDTTPPDLGSCTITNTALECSGTENEAIADAWNADNIAVLESCGTDSCNAGAIFEVTSDYDFSNLETICGPCGSITVIYSIADDCGNSSTLTAILTLSDNTEPDLSSCLIDDTTIECSGTSNEAIANQWNADNIAAIENCAEDIAAVVTSDYAFSNLSSTCGAGGTITVLYTVTDDCDNVSTLTTTLTLEDTTPPDYGNCSVFDITFECDGIDNEGIAETWNEGNIAAIQNCGTDSCGNVFSVSSDYAFTNLNSTCGFVGTIFVTYTITDDCGNFSLLPATLTIVDNTAPEITIQASDSTVECNNFSESIFQDWLNNSADANASDSCSEITWTNNYSEGNWIENCGNQRHIDVIFYASDACGNTVETSARFSTEDNTPPVIDGIDNFESLVQYCNDVPTIPIITASDECSDNLIYDEPIITIEGIEGSVDYTIIRDWVITDECGNQTTLQQILLVNQNCDCLSDKLISKVVTPNGDEFNDYFNVEGIDDCGIPTLKIFNRWGSLVYESSNYDSKGRWRGESQGGLSMEANNKLPTGTYYYIIEITNSDIKPITGYIYLGTK